MTGRHVIGWFERFDVLVGRHASWLTELDAAIGDADHGRILRAGAAAAARSVRATGEERVGALMAGVVDAFSAASGGAGGILFSTFFHGLSDALSDRTDASPAEFADAFTSGVSRLQALGNAGPGDKTMVDALVPAATALQAAAGTGQGLRRGLERAVSAAETGRDATIPLIARRGRASYLRERSAGHLDPGAASSTLLLQSLLTAVSGPGAGTPAKP